MTAAYQQTLDYLYSRLPVFQHVGNSALKNSLVNIQAICKALNHPENKFRCIHVAGTNGKGSVSSMLAAVFTTHGYKTGLYTSPHLKDFRERIRIDGEEVSKEFIVEFTEKVKPLIEALNPSFFEITVAMAFEWFALQKVDMAIIEVGLGGRLDSTNVVTPLLSVITNIGWDHMDILGDSLEKIAAEKGGIIKEGIPILLGEVGLESFPVLDKIAKAKNAPFLVAAEADIEFVIHCSLKGNYQVKNIGTVISALKMLEEEGFEFDKAKILEALSDVNKFSGLRGRWDILGKDPLIIVDTAHNRDGIDAVMRQLMGMEFSQLHIILGMVKEKDLMSILPLFPKDARYYFAKPAIFRGLDVKILRDEAAKFGLQGHAFDSVKAAFMGAKKAAKASDIVFAGGSTFVVAEII